jgi:hypothetical protein
MTSQSEIKILKYRTGVAYQDFPYPEYPEYFPTKLVSLLPLGIEEQNIIRRINHHEIDPSEISPQWSHLCKPEHQIGGEPFLVQPWIELDCVRCSRTMAFLASIGDDTGSMIGFTGNPFVQTIFCLCTHCRIVGAYQQCD